MASRYEAIAQYLSRQPGPNHTVSVEQIEQIVGYPLPPTAFPDHRWFRLWWCNDRVGHVQSRFGWLAAGWEVDSVDRDRGTVTFRK
jgi:hypothetical protein